MLRRRCGGSARASTLFDPPITKGDPEFGSGPLDHPELVEIKARLDEAEIEAAQRLLAELGDLAEHRAAISYFSTRLLYQRGRLDQAGVVERLRELVLAEPEFRQASAMLAAAERGTLRPDREGFQRATLSPFEPPTSEPAASDATSEHGEVGAPSSTLVFEDPFPSTESMSTGRTTENARLAPELEADASQRMPLIPRAPIVPRFNPGNSGPSYAPTPFTTSTLFELRLEEPRALGGSKSSLTSNPVREPVSAPDLPTVEAANSDSDSAKFAARAHNPESTLARARELWAEGAVQMSLSHFERLELAPLLDPELRAECARSLIAAHQPVRAQAQARRALLDDPNSSIAQLMLVWSLVCEDRRDHASANVEEAERGLSRMRSLPRAEAALVQALRATILAEKGDCARALTTAKLALKLDPNLLDAEAARCLASARLGRFDEAQAALQRVRVLSPEEAQPLSARVRALGLTLPDRHTVSAPTSGAARVWGAIEMALIGGDRALAIAAFERSASGRLQGLADGSSADAMPLLATLAAAFFTTEPVFHHFAPYDLSMHSVARIEAALSVLYGPRTDAQPEGQSAPALFLLASYLGECVRQGYGGIWRGSVSAPETVFVHSGRARFAPFREIRLRLKQGKPLSAGDLGHRRARESGAPIVLFADPPTPWDLARWPSAKLMPSLGAALGHSVVGVYCTEFGGGPLARTLGSLRALDAYATLVAPTGVRAPEDARWLNRASLLIGAYLGETLCAVAGASWCETDETAIGPESYGLSLPKGVIFPVRVACDRLSGKAAGSLSDYARRLTGLAARSKRP